MSLKKNEEIQVKIIDLSYEGNGVAKVDGYPLFIENALPDEIVNVRVIKVNKNYGFAKVLSWQEKSPFRVEIEDTKFMQTGIAPLQHMVYEKQLEFKEQQVKNSLQKFNLTPNVHTVYKMTKPSNYRNKAQVPIRKIDGKLQTGFYKKRTHQFIAMDKFYLHEAGIDEVLHKVCQILTDYKLSAYDEEKHQGVLRHLVIRKGHYTNEIMVTLVTRKEKLINGEQIAQKIIEKCPNVVSVMQNINPDKTNVILGSKTKCLGGKPYLEDKMLDKIFKIAPQSFYQVNTIQAEALYQKALNIANFKGNEIVIDAYSGIGTITLAIAPYVKHVYGVEIIPEAIINAKENANINQIENVTFVCNKAEEQIKIWQEAGLNPDIIFVDPPRKGLATSFVEALKKLKPRKIVYISCNPATFARDVSLLSDLYSIKDVYPFDLFPETTHVEVVGALSLKNKLS